jgi:N-methylhydantoinase A
VYFAEAAGFVPTPIYRRERLLGGHLIAGPAVIEQMDATTVIPPGQRARVDDRANLVIDTGGAPGSEVQTRGEIAWTASPWR